MRKLNFHKMLVTAPREKLLILQKLDDAYKLWQNFLRHIPKTSRYTLGVKIDIFFLETIEQVYSAGYAATNQKLDFAVVASKKLDMLKFLLKIAWEIKALNNKEYIILSKKLYEIGRMLGRWLENLRKLPAFGGEKKDSF